MKTTLKLIPLLLMVFAISISSCSKDGADGATGPAGATGQAGVNGVDGADGEDGEDGEDGNANVQTFLFDVSDKSGASIPVTVPALTQDVIDNDLVLGYLTKTNSYVPLPQPIYAVSLGDNYSIATEIKLSKYWMFFYQVGTENLKNMNVGKLNSLKIVIVKANNSASGKSSKSDILSELKANGVDINNYYNVMDYYGLNY